MWKFCYSCYSYVFNIRFTVNLYRWTTFKKTIFSNDSLQLPIKFDHRHQFNIKAFYKFHLCRVRKCIWCNCKRWQEINQNVYYMLGASQKLNIIIQDSRKCATIFHSFFFCTWISFYRTFYNQRVKEHVWLVASICSNIRTNTKEEYFCTCLNICKETS